MVATAAGVFGFGVIFALHQVLAGVFGPRISRRLAAPVQSGLVLLLATGLMLLPGLATRVEPRLRQPGGLGWLPPMWFVGLHDVWPATWWTACRGRTRRAMRQAASPVDIERTATSRYRQDRPVLARLAGTARAALGLTLLVAAVAYAWNSRRLPAPDSEYRGAVGRGLGRPARHARSTRSSHSRGVLLRPARPGSQRPASDCAGDLGRHRPRADHCHPPTNGCAAGRPRRDVRTPHDSTAVPRCPVPGRLLARDARARGGTSSCADAAVVARSRLAVPPRRDARRARGGGAALPWWCCLPCASPRSDGLSPPLMRHLAA